MPRPSRLVLAATIAASSVQAQQLPSRAMLPIDFANSAEAGWLAKPVTSRRTLDDMREIGGWKLSGAGALTLVDSTKEGDRRAVRVEMKLNRPPFATPLPAPLRLPSVNLSRVVASEDWRAYNRIAIWIRPDYSGVPVVPLLFAMRSEGAEKVPDRYGREGTHVITLQKNGWQQVMWEIDPLARDKVTRIEFGYFPNRMIARPEDHIAFEIGPIELQQVDPDVHTGWTLGAGKLAFSHSGYQLASQKTALASGLTAPAFEVLRVDDVAFPWSVLRKPVRNVQTPTGAFQELDFSEIKTPGRYVLRTGDNVSKPFTIGDNAWLPSIWKSLNFYYGNRCGFDVPGVHELDHLDWFAVKGDQRISMAGGWHDAGDLSQGVINTGEGSYAMFALAEQLQAQGGDPALIERLYEEATWGLDWVMRVRFPGGYRLGFGSLNFWTDNVAGTADDRAVEAKNNPNANYISAAAEAIAARVLKTRDPARATRALQLAREDWEYAIVGIEGPSTWHTPAFAASRMELAGIGITASVELWRSTGEARFRDKAVELARVVAESQQVSRVGSTFPLAGFFYTGPDRDTIFHQFHRAADQAGVVALEQMVRAFPDHPEWMKWYSTVVRYAEYQKKSAAITAPYEVLPAYVYRVVDSVQVPDSGGRYLEKQSEYAAQVRAGTPMGDGWYLRTFPVWFQRRGNYGVLLSQAKALASASRLRGDNAGLELATRQAEWVVGRNPFSQSTMYGEGYDWAQQYSVSSGDMVGTLPVGMQSRGTTDLPYWPSQNMYVYKEVWVHSNNRWLWLMQDLLPNREPTRPFVLSSQTLANGDIEVSAILPPGTKTAPALKLENARQRGGVTLMVADASDAQVFAKWTVRRIDASAPWIAAIMIDGRSADAFGW